VRVRAGESPETVAARIGATVDNVTVQTQQTFAAQERRIVSDMSTDILTIMNAVGLVIGLAVTALTVYTATLARRKEYGVLKGLGARSSQLYRVVLAQAFTSVALGFALALVITLLLTIAVPRWQPALVLEVRSESLLKLAGAALLIAGLSAGLPIRQIAGLDPAIVFRGSAA
jgi:putative ABC transport system permease protein